MLSIKWGTDRTVIVKARHCACATRLYTQETIRKTKYVTASILETLKLSKDEIVLANSSSNKMESLCEIQSLIVQLIGIQIRLTRVIEDVSWMKMELVSDKIGIGGSI